MPENDDDPGFDPLPSRLFGAWTGRGGRGVLGFFATRPS
jgi:hypothetical protein